MPFRKQNEGNELQTYVTLMTGHQANLRAFIVSLMPGSQDVDDVLQNTNAVLWQKRARFQHGTNFTAWAFKIARYEVLAYRNRIKRDGLIVFTDRLVEALAEMGPFEQTNEEVLAALDGCLERLSDNQRNLVKARYTPGRSLEQHAATVDKSPGSLRIALLRIRAILRDCVETKLGTKFA
ncbi:sigma-70 family RNA polymerase sigma factor [Haloferula sp. A504]|uniref:sigma-70 family RNA polymerase sigma factor n=1 Tax=Haloferula sp. A504 TaxID=3373601 RepID=UPI0031BE2599|nr:sigma-70 family RNA polymerase sigma factor [Verrucomicrobiaceae bacterium E54]